MRLILLFSLVLLIGCDQALDTQAPVQSGAKREELTPVPSTSSKHIWLGSDTYFDTEFTIVSSGGTPWMQIETFDQSHRRLASYHQGLDYQPRFSAAPYQLAASGPTNQTWDMVVCPTESISDIPDSTDPACEVLDDMTDGQVQFMGAAEREIRSVHHKPGHTVFDYRNTADGGAKYYKPSALPAPGQMPPPNMTWEHIPSVTYVAMKPLLTNVAYDVKRIVITWPSYMEIRFDCEVKHSGGDTSCGGGSSSTGGGSGGGNGGA